MPHLALAWSILRHDRRRLVGSCLGIAFAVLLMFAELGFLNGIYDSPTVPIARLNADLVMLNAIKENMYPPTPFQRSRLAQARMVDGVISAHALYIHNHVFLKVPGQVAHPLRLFGFDPDRPAFALPELATLAPRLRRQDSVLFDRKSRPIYGSIAPGIEAELDGRRVEVVGQVALGTGLAFIGNAFVSEETYLRVLRASRDQVELGLLELAPDADAAAVKGALNRALPQDVRVVLPDELVASIQGYWRANEAAGAVFTLGMALGFAVGVMICSEILFNQVSDHQTELATLKAIGYRDSFLIGVVLCQALILGLLGFVPGWLGSLGTYRLLTAMAGLQMWLTPGRVAFVFALTLAMCTISAGLAVRKVLRVDPAELF